MAGKRGIQAGRVLVAPGVRYYVIRILPEPGAERPVRVQGASGMWDARKCVPI